MVDNERGVVDLVTRYLEACAGRRLEEAEGCLADHCEIVFPWGRFTALPQLFAEAQRRYRWARKHYESWDVVRHADGSVIVIVAGTLYGETLAGTPFAGVRYIDRFVLRDGRIAQHQVWNDLAEWGMTTREGSASQVSQGGR